MLIVYVLEQTVAAIIFILHGSLCCMIIIILTHASLDSYCFPYIEMSRRTVKKKVKVGACPDLEHLRVAIIGTNNLLFNYECLALLCFGCCVCKSTRTKTKGSKVEAT